MKTRTRTGLLVTAPLLLTACATQYVAQVPPSLKCEPPAVLMAPCPAPAALKSGLTYRELLEVHLADRQQLQRCAAQQDDLRRTINTCNARIEAHNAELAKAAGKKP
ncbi:hypothetical protein [Sphaerotilus sp.]|uniref:Rz1-like lysis system protein LysC n=1 Tax=Sphaerotilus sp. TaxID=2093942 RepID=UPI002ACDECE7|nr:hypothetical protein [Sphaerotilus sp.]MDZ7855225.1 hypothetical protein [Sphaerotilus sp.]